MKYSFVILLLVGAFVAATLAEDYMWGEIGPNDVLLEKAKVKKAFVVGLVVSKKYIFKQSNDLNAATITGIRVTDKKKKGATADLSSGGPGSKGATIKFKSQRGNGINSVVEIWGR